MWYRGIEIRLPINNRLESIRLSITQKNSKVKDVTFEFFWCVIDSQMLSNRLLTSKLKFRKLHP